jgi:hypothetical protein
MRGGHRREAEWFRTPKEGWGGGGGGGVDAKKEGKGLEAVASIELKGWVPRDIRQAGNCSHLIPCLEDNFSNHLAEFPGNLAKEFGH